MIHPLRQRHRRIFMALGIILPLALAFGIAARKPVPKMSALPSELVSTPQKFTAQVWERTDLFVKPLINVRLLREAAHAGRYAMACSAPKDFIQPDLIFYWVAGNPSLTGDLPSNAQLLGAFTSSAISLPDKVVAQAGALILYSLADHEVIARSKPFEIFTP